MTKKEIVENIVTFLFLVLVGFVFVFFLLNGISDEQDRREKQKSSRKWMQERALNEWATSQGVTK